jgi:hypothetical protein
MANKTSANQGSSGEQERGAPRVSRKVIGKTSAAYERKAGAEGGEEKKPGSEGEQAGDQGAQAEGQPAPDVTAAGAEATPEQARSEGSRPTRKESGSRREAKTTSEQAPAAPAGEPAAAAPRGEKAAPAPESAPASTSPGAEAQPAPAAPSAEQPPVPKADPAADFEVLLKPREIERWDPSTPAAPPTKAPPGDSRSFRRRGENGEEFVLIYRSASFLIRRAGRVGVMGTWTVTEYPNIGSAAHAYAQQCSDLVHAGFRDLR